ncbi:MAG: DUF4290 domain-containing protein [Bacteroidaceae bacterium]|nr:DUF4290 domain-containing protein [Bacteroidaceae bacterium]MBO4589437.1 DUF4290 domain-containing protein [Bacteroidaceae bacterium]
MIYNTQEKKLSLPEYGRSIQSMVDYAVTIEDRAERQRCANTIVAIMKNMFPDQRDVPDYERKLWDHLAIMSDFKLDIDYPYEVIRPEAVHAAPDRVPYSNGNIRYRHYGRYIPDMIEEACQLPDGPMRDELLRLIAIQMKKEHLMWNKEGLEDEKILNDIFEFSGGRLRLNPDSVQLAAYKAPPANAHPQQQSSGKKKKKKKKNY